MNRDLTASECRILDRLYDGSIPNTDIPGPVLASVLRLGLADVTWAGRARLTAEGRALFNVCGVAG